MIMLSTIFFSVFLLAQAAFPWGWAVHAYIDEQFDTKWQLRNTNHLYGVLTPDIFNYQFDAASLYMHAETHNDFMRVWDAARSVPGRALAFGFVSHNEAWGIDYTAHRSGITFGQAGTIPGHPEEGGYVVAKAYILKGILEQIPQFNALQLPESLALTVAHELTEYGIDILMKQVDPQIGARITAAALPPDPNFPMLLEKAYADQLTIQFGMTRTEALKFIASSQKQFQQAMIVYGQVLSQDDSTAVLLISQHLADLAATFMAAYGLPPLPPDVDITPLLQFGIGQAMLLCAGDFLPEVSATVTFVEGQLALHGVVN